MIIPVIIIAVLIGIFAFFSFAKKFNSKRTTLIRKKTVIEKIMYSFYVIFHPFDGFWDLSHEGREAWSRITPLYCYLCGEDGQTAFSGYLFSSDSTSIWSEPLCIIPASVAVCYIELEHYQSNQRKRDSQTGGDDILLCVDADISSDFSANPVKSYSSAE